MEGEAFLNKFSRQNAAFGAEAEGFFLCSETRGHHEDDQNESPCGGLQWGGRGDRQELGAPGTWCRDAHRLKACKDPGAAELSRSF